MNIPESPEGVESGQGPNLDVVAQRLREEIESLQSLLNNLPNDISDSEGYAAYRSRLERFEGHLQAVEAGNLPEELDL